MKKNILLIALGFILIKNATAQVICIYCYDQNAPISGGINNLILNGSFENGCPFNGAFCPSSALYSCNFTDWTCTGGGQSTYARVVDDYYSTLPDGNKAPYFGNALAYACSPNVPDTSCFVAVGCTVGGVPAGYPINSDTAYGGAAGVSLEQTINGLIAGNIYVLEFWAGGENSFAYSGLFGVDVGFGDTLLRDKPTWPLLSNTPDTIGTRYIIEFIAASSSHTIKFTNWGHVGLQATELIIDDVRLYTLAELPVFVPHCTSGINEADASGNSIVIFPNPVSNELAIKTNNGELSEIFIYDIESRKLLQQEFTNSITLNMEQLSKGIYLYELKSKNEVVKKGKFVKE